MWLLMLVLASGDLVDRDGYQIYVDQTGSGTPMLLIPGLGVTHETWRFLVPELEKKFQLVMIDLRGTGASSDADSPYTLVGMAEDGLAVMDHLGHETFDVVGLSLGSFVAQQLTVLAPERVGRLVLIGSTQGGSAHVPPTNEVLGFFMSMAAMSPEDRVDKGLALALHPEFMADHPKTVSDLRNTSLNRPVNPQVLIKQTMVGATFDFTQTANSIRVPTLVVHGAQDQIVPAENGKRLAAVIPGARLTVIDPGGHACHIDAARSVAQAILQFELQPEVVRD